MEKHNNIFSTKIVKYMLAILIIIVILFFLYNCFNKDSASKKDEVSFYVSNLENKLENCLSSVEGTGRVSVCISVDSGMETILATKKN